MKELLQVLGLLALIQGVGGLMHMVTGWLDGWGLVQRLAFFYGYETYASTTLIVLALALFAAAESRGRGKR